MMIGVKGKQLCPGNPNADGQTDGRTDGHGDPSIPPPNFVAEGIKIEIGLLNDVTLLQGDKQYQCHI